MRRKTARALLSAVSIAILCGAFVGSSAAFVTRSGTKLSSDAVPVLGIETEVADDFSPIVSGTSVTVTVYGGSYSTSLPPPGYTVRIYTDAGCVPGTLLASFSGLSGSPVNQSPPTDTDGFDIYLYTFVLNFPVVGGNVYWCSVQAEDHPYPPQWGVQLVPPSGCVAMFKSSFFGYPDWTLENLVPEQPADVHMIVSVGEPTAVEHSTWGKVRDLYR